MEDEEKRVEGDKERNGSPFVDSEIFFFFSLFFSVKL